MRYENPKDLINAINFARIIGDSKQYGDLVLQAYEYSYNLYSQSCEILRRTKDIKLEGMLIGMRDNLDTLGKLHTEHIEKMNGFWE